MSDGCLGEEKGKLDLSHMVHLKCVRIGNHCFGNANDVIITGLRALESVVIGEHCFSSKKKNIFGFELKRCFHLCDCPKLKELKIGCLSFSVFGVCKIENVDALEVIQMGDLNGWSYNFEHASLELKSILIKNE